ncbi:MAG: hypothetical protein U5L00_10805 [Desulfovermiculus sp.]|nr:hypothetical protein [Desulfovermiculus sp.]
MLKKILVVCICCLAFFNSDVYAQADETSFTISTSYKSLLSNPEQTGMLEPPLASRNMYLYMHKKHRHLVELLAGALRRMKQDGTYARIVTETTAHVAVPPHGKK